MCGRYVRRSTRNAIANFFGISPDGVPEFALSYNVAPQTFQPVVRLNRDSNRRTSARSWPAGRAELRSASRRRPAPQSPWLAVK
ncbi:MAG TPA: SOS response-associated peptidase family protein [Acidobacteriaceae bacterium]|nr:SOS response-associated peptidase family protein [Acidobacteriaceae bacterium]